MSLTQQTSQTPEIMTIPAAAAYLQVSKPHLYALARRNEFAVIRLGRSVRVRRSVLDAYLDRCSSGAVNRGNIPYK